MKGKLFALLFLILVHSASQGINLSDYSHSDSSKPICTFLSIFRRFKSFCGWSQFFPYASGCFCFIVYFPILEASSDPKVFH